MRSSFNRIASVLKITQRVTPTATPTTSPRISSPTNFNPNRQIEVNPDSWLARNVFDHHIQMAYKNFISLKALMLSENEEKNLEVIEKFYDSLQIFELIERLGKVSYSDFFLRDKNGEIKFNKGSGRAGNAPEYNRDADSVIPSQIGITMQGLISFCSTLPAYKENCIEAVRLTIELIRFVDMIKAAHDIATVRVLAMEAEKKAKDQSHVYDLFSIYRHSQSSDTLRVVTSSENERLKGKNRIN